MAPGLSGYLLAPCLSLLPLLALSQLNNSGCPFLNRAIVSVNVMVELTQPCKEWDALCSERGCLLPITLHL